MAALPLPLLSHGRTCPTNAAVGPLAPELATLGEVDGPRSIAAVRVLRVSLTDWCNYRCRCACRRKASDGCRATIC